MDKEETVAILREEIDVSLDLRTRKLLGYGDPLTMSDGEIEQLTILVGRRFDDGWDPVCDFLDTITPTKRQPKK